MLHIPRIPRKGSRRVAFFQHGLLDTASAWVSNGNLFSLGCRAYEAGYDVFLGNFRGTDDSVGGAGGPRHATLSPSSGDFWCVSVVGSGAWPAMLTSHAHTHTRVVASREYSVDDHSLDLIAVIDKIRQIKLQEAVSSMYEASARQHTSSSSPRHSRRHRRRRTRTLSSSSTGSSSGRHRRRQRSTSETSTKHSTNQQQHHHHHHPVSLPMSPAQGAAEVAGEGGDSPAHMSLGAAATDAGLVWGEAGPPRITGVGHSMGGAALLGYIMACRALGIPHGLHRTILLSPAGTHVHVPLFARAVVSVVAPTLIGNGPFPLRSSRVQTAGARLLQDLKRSPATKDFMASVAAVLFGGERHRFPFQNVHFTDYPIGGSSTRVMQQGVQCMRAAKYLPFSYGERENWRRYGSAQPPR